MRNRVGQIAVSFACAGLSLSIIIGVMSGVSYWVTVLRALEAAVAFAALGCIFGLLLAR